MQRIAYFVYGLVCHVLFLGVFVWMALFLGNLLIGRTVDAPGAGFSWSALAVDVGLIALFGLQHSVMARPGFKRWWTRFVPSEIERSTYVLATCVVTATTGRVLMWSLFGAGWLAVPLVSLLINHFDLFGLRQVWLALKGRAYTHLPFKTPGIYRFVRHPLYVGWTIFFWATPTMTIGHMLFAVGMTGYMLLAIPIEERDLITQHGEDYTRYRREVPAMLPRFSLGAAPTPHRG
ncbi:MAG: methyltransferase family protein [Planctomycetota bacterium]|jgi:protein-S-isoprenylcysteine O-methyltransferase Ste14